MRDIIKVQKAPSFCLNDSLSNMSVKQLAGFALNLQTDIQFRNN